MGATRSMPRRPLWRKLERTSWISLTGHGICSLQRGLRLVEETCREAVKGRAQEC